MELLDRVLAQLAARPKLEVLPREGDAEPRRVRTSLKDPQGKTSEVARAATPRAPLQLSVIEQRAWYERPWVYAGGAAAVFFVASDPG